MSSSRKLKGGYTGKTLHVNLTTGRFAKENLNTGLAEHFIGGTGLASHYMFNLLNTKISPLSPENILLFVTGPITGTGFSGSGRFMAASKSPLTGIWGEAHSGGFFGPELKYAGFDLLLITGRSPKPLNLVIEDDYITLEAADSFWGMNIERTTDSLLDLHPDHKVACIGPAGENLVHYAAIMNDYHHALGRTGLGAVMGSKNLKAIIIRGTKDILVSDPDAFEEAMNSARSKLNKGIWGEIHENSLGKYGTASLVSAINQIGRMPTRNHLTGYYSEADKIDEFAIAENYRVHRESCFNCYIQCKFMSRIEGGLFKSLASGPEYETIMAFGSNCLNPDLESILYANYLCNQYGLDTISTGCTIAFALECGERGILTNEDGLDYSWGNTDTIITLIHKIAKREGIGDLLADGSRLAAEKLGGQAPRYAIHVKGLEASGQDPRAQYSVGITYGSNVRGADHLRSLSCLEELDFPNATAARFGEEKVSAIHDLRSPKYKALVVADMEILYAIVDSMLVCKYGTMWAPALYFDDFAPALASLTGIESFNSPNTLRQIGQRICTLRKCFNYREGLRRKEDQLLHY